MDGLEEAVRALILAAEGPPAEYETTRERADTVVREAPQADSARRTAALHLLAPVVAGAQVPHAGILALACGVLVEIGADPLAVLQPVLDRLRETLEPAARFVGVLRDAAGAAGDEDNDLDTLLERYEPQVGPQMRAETNAFGSFDLLWRPACTLLAVSTEARRLARAEGALADGVRTLADVHGGAAFLGDLLQVLDDAELLVLDPARRRGYEVVIGGIGDNFQLHTLLADALIGDPASGWLPGTRPDPRVVALARDAAAQDGESGDLFAEGAFNLVNWTGLAADGTMPTGSGASAQWIWGEGVPADILPFEGIRVVLLGPPPYARTWNPQRRFPLMRAEISVRRQLSVHEVDAWVRRLAAASH